MDFFASPNRKYSNVYIPYTTVYSAKSLITCAYALTYKIDSWKTYGFITCYNLPFLLTTVEKF